MEENKTDNIRKADGTVPVSENAETAAKNTEAPTVNTAENKETASPAVPMATPEKESISFKWDYAGQDEYNKQARRRESLRSGLFYTLTALLVFTLAFVSIGAVVLLDSFSKITQVIERENTVYIREDNSQTLTVSEIASKVKPSVVVIEGAKKSEAAAGSGFIIDESGYIATNFHVAGDCEAIKVILYDGSEYDATYIGGDALSDIALIKINAKGLVPAEIGDSAELVVGEDVVAIGNPSGNDYRNTVTNGIISALERRVKVYNSSGELEKTMTLIQTNADLNHGNSGGPLVNSRGQVIGINVIRLESGYTGMGFALPISESMDIIAEIKSAGKDIVRNSSSIAVRNAVLGITGKAVLKKTGAPVDGVQVESVNDGYDAQKKGLKKGDIITQINGMAVDAISDIKNVTSALTADDTVDLKVYRDGAYFDITVILGFAS